MSDGSHDLVDVQPGESIREEGDAAVIRYALELTDRNTDAHQAAWVALDRVAARLSEAEQQIGALNSEAEQRGAILSRAEARLSGYEEALRDSRAFIERARPLLGIALSNSLGAQADRLYVQIGAALSGSAGNEQGEAP